MTSPTIPSTWRHCQDCDTTWKGDGPCFSCGNEAPNAWPPMIYGTQWVADLAKGAGPV